MHCEMQSKIVELAEHDIKLQATLIAFNENLKFINDNLENVIDTSVKLSERIKVLESDLSERNYRKNFMSILMMVYPMIIILLLIITNLDHESIQQLLTNIEEIVQVSSE